MSSDIYKRSNPIIGEDDGMVVHLHSTMGSRLKECRGEKGVPQHVAAKAVGISQPNLSGLENDEYPTSSYVPQLALYYNVSALWLATGHGIKAAGKLDEKTEKMLTIYLQLPEDAQAAALALLETMAKLNK